MKIKMKIVVLAGGISTERDVSLISGAGILKALREKGHQVILLDVFLGYKKRGEDVSNIFEKAAEMDSQVNDIQSVDPDIEQVKKMRDGDEKGLFGPNVIEICRQADIVYMGLHGADGENGKVQAAFDVLGIKYTGSDYLGSALAMDKGMAKKVFLQSKIPTPNGFTMTKSHIHELPEEIGYPCIVKPCCGGSSVGMSIVKNETEYKKALDLAFKYENEVVVEEYIKGREFSVGVIGGKSLPIIEIIPKSGVYDYETKYQPGMATDVCPAPLSDEITDKMQTYAIDVYRELKLGSYARIDYLLDADDNMYCLEANTLPGMTATSLLPQEAKVLGIEYGVLCEQVIAQALAAYNGESEELTKPGTNSHYGKADLKKL